MAVPSYTTDLATHNDCTSVTGMSEATGFTNTDGSGEVDSDLAIYGTVCVSEAQRKSGKGSIIYTGTSRTLPTNGGFFMWYKFFAPNALLTRANGGIQMFVGSSSSAFRQYYVNGSDTYPYGGWKNYFADPTKTASATTGSPTTSYASVGFGVDLSVGIAKGNSHTMDIVRYGRGEAIVTGGETADYATYAGLALVNDATTARWGLFQDVGGSFLWKGLQSLGTASTAVDFRDSNKNINVDDTLFADASFNRIEVNNASSNIEWTSINITALGTVSRGQFEMIDNATLLWNGCTFTDMDTFKFLSNSEQNASTYRRCNQVDQGGSTIDGTLFEASTDTYALNADIPSLVTNCTFKDNATALYIPATVTGTITLSGDVFTGNTVDIYWAGTTGTLTVNSPSATTWASAGVGTAGNGDVVIQNAVVLTIGAADGVSLVGAEVRIYDYDNTPAGSLGTELDGAESNATSTFVYVGSGSNVIWIQIMKDGYNEYNQKYTMPTADATFTANLKQDLNK